MNTNIIPTRYIFRKCLTQSVKTDEQDSAYPEKCTALLLYGFITVKVAKEYKTLTAVGKQSSKYHIVD